MIFDDPVLRIAGYIAAGILGLCLGSFATAMTYRIPRGISWISNHSGAPARSACPSCGHVLGVRDLIPLFSWLFSRGRCRHCGAPVSAFYPVVEISTALAVLALYAAWGPTLTGICLYLAVPFLLAALIVDWRHMILPDSINVALCVLALAFIAAHRDLDMVLSHAAAGIILPGGLYLVGVLVARIKGRAALGLGDVKFLVPAGIFLGIAALPSYLIIAGILGVLTGLYRRGEAFPFGPSLIISLYLHFFLTGLGFDYT